MSQGLALIQASRRIRPASGKNADDVGIIAAFGSGALVDVGGRGALVSELVGHVGEGGSEAPPLAGPSPCDALPVPLW